MADFLAPLPAGLPATFLPALLKLLPNGVVYYTPLYDTAGNIVDFDFAYLNPAAQQLLRLPAQPTTTYLQQWPSNRTSGAFAFHCEAFLADEPTQSDKFYSVDSHKTRLCTHACRLEAGLLVSLAEATACPSPTATEAQQARRIPEQQVPTAAEVQQATLQRVFEQAPIAIAILEGPGHVITLANNAMSLLWGRPVASVLGQPHFMALSDLANQGFETIFTDVYQTGRVYSLREQLVYIDRIGTGKLIPGYFNIVYQPLYSAAGHITSIIASAMDVTEQVLVRQQVQNLNEELAVINEELRASNEEFLEANTALSEAQQQLQQLNQELEVRVAHRTQALQAAQADADAQRGELQRLFEQAPVAMVMYRGPQYVVEFANTKAGEHWGRSPASLLNRPVFESFPEGRGQGVEELFDGVLASGIPHVAHEQPVLIDRYGRHETIYWDVVIQPLRESTGHITGLLSVGTEVTTQVQARQQVQALNEELAAINEELIASNEELNNTNTQLTRTNVDLDTFIYTASHDLKAPIANIESILLALRAHLPAEVQQEELVAHLLELLGSTVRRFQLTITQLTDLSKLQLTLAGPAEAVPLAALLNEVSQDLAPAIEAAEVQLTVEIDPELVVFFAPKTVRSVVYNLLSNAIKYRDPARPVRVRVHAEQTLRTVILTVQDNGLGLTEAQQGRLFGLFQRLHTHVEGTGVGLYTIKRLIENAGGTIGVQSAAGVGSTFRVTFPV